jgi:hypothetical protein
MDNQGWHAPGTSGKCLLAEFGAEAANEFGRKLGNVHAFGNKEFAAEYGAALIVVGELAIHATVLAILVPAKPAVWDRIRTDELKRAEKRIPFRHQKSLAENRHLNKLFIRTKHVRHEYRLRF